ncbi:MAG: hypothetical protein U0795_17335 [Pirellulales bacterium]
MLRAMRWLGEVWKWGSWGAGRETAEWESGWLAGKVFWRRKSMIGCDASE